MSIRISFLALGALLAAAPAPAFYANLPASGQPACPLHGEFFQDHFCWLGTKANQDLTCIPCPTPANDLVKSRVLRGGQPLSAAGVASLKRLGVALIVDLRSKAEVRRSEEPQQAEQNGIAYFNVAMNTGNNDAPMNEAALFRAVGLIRHALAARPGALVYFHCQRGEDRTGLIAAAVRLLLEDRDREQIQKEMRQHYFNSNYRALKDVWLKLTRSDANRILEPTAAEKELIEKSGFLQRTLSQP